MNKTIYTISGISGLVLTVILTLAPSLSLSQSDTASNNLTGVCAKAREDLASLAAFTSAANSSAYNNQLNQIHDYWTNLLSNDSCILGRCTADSPEYKKNQIVTTINSLTSNLLIQGGFGVPNNLQKSIDDANTLLNANCS